MPVCNLSARAETYIDIERESIGLKTSEFIEVLIEFYELEHLELLIGRIREKYNNYEFDAAALAQLRILRTVLENIV